jgi:hypothetical protein
MKEFTMKRIFRDTHPSQPNEGLQLAPTNEAKTMTAAVHQLLQLVILNLILSLGSGFNPLVHVAAYGKACRASNTPLCMTQVDAEVTRELYNIKHSCWTSPQWNWGSARGMFIEFIIYFWRSKGLMFFHCTTTIILHTEAVMLIFFSTHNRYRT